MSKETENFQICISNFNIGLSIVSLSSWSFFKNSVRGERMKQRKRVYLSVGKGHLPFGLTILPYVLVRLPIGLIKHQDQKQFEKEQVNFSFQLWVNAPSLTQVRAVTQQSRIWEAENDAEAIEESCLLASSPCLPLSDFSYTSRKPPQW